MSNGTNPNASSAYADRRAYRATAGSAGSMSHGAGDAVTSLSATRTGTGSADPYSVANSTTASTRSQSWASRRGTSVTVVPCPVRCRSGGATATSYRPSARPIHSTVGPSAARVETRISSATRKQDNKPIPN